MADNTARIDAIRELLRTGATRIVKDGLTVEFDIPSLRSELNRLQAEDDNHKGRRPRVSRINLDS